MQISSANLLVLLIACLLIGCEKVTTSRALALESYLETPTGNYAFRPISAKEAAELDIYKYHQWYLLAESPNVKVLFSCVGTIRIGSSLGHQTFALDPGQTKYEHAGESRRAMYYKNPIIDGTLRNQWFTSNIDDPDNFRHIEMRIAHAEPSEDLHHFIIPFSVAGGQYVAHLPVKVEVHTMYEHRINVPATP